MSRKTHKNLGQSSLLPLQLNKVKLTLHRHSFYFNYLQSADNKFLMYRTDGNNSHTIRMLQKKLDTFRTAKIH